MTSTARDLAGKIDAFFERGRELWWDSRWTLRRRTLRACGSEIPLLLSPWRAARRPGGGTPPPAAPDVGERVIEKEALWKGNGIVLTPNRYPAWKDHLLLWERRPLREPGPAFLELLLRLCREREDLFAFVNSIGAAATVSRAHAQVVRLGESPPVAGTPVHTRPSGSEEIAFPPGEGPWPAFFARLAGDPPAVARTLARLIRLRLCPAFNLAFSRDKAWIFFRRRESVPSGYPLPLGALELSGLFLFEEEASFLAMTPGGIESSLREASFPPGPPPEEALLAALA